MAIQPRACTVQLVGVAGGRGRVPGPTPQDPEWPPGMACGAEFLGSASRTKVSRPRRRGKRAAGVVPASGDYAKENNVTQQGITALVGCWVSGAAQAQTFTRIETQGRFNGIQVRVAVADLHRDGRDDIASRSTRRPRCRRTHATRESAQASKDSDSGRAKRLRPHSEECHAAAKPAIPAAAERIPMSHHQLRRRRRPRLGPGLVPS